MSLSSVRMMDTFTHMIRENFPLEEHRFVYWDRLRNADQVLLEYGNSVEIIGSRFERFKTLCRELDQADIIIWHGMMFGARRALLLLLFPQYRKKSVWVMRGLDLYNWKNKRSGIKGWLINKINYLSRKNIPNVGVIFHTDQEVYEKQFGTNARFFYLPYPIAGSAFALMEQFKVLQPRSNQRVYIQVAHNAYTFNNHLQILENIKQFGDENVRVIIPLSYGNDWYEQQENYFTTVKQLADEYFGSKAVCLKQLMPPLEYSKLLCNIDIGIYGAERQNGLGNILRSLYLGNKVYLNKKNPLYDFFISQGIAVYDMDSIPTATFEEFKELPESTGAVNWIRQNFYPGATAFYWKVMFDYFKGEPVPEDTDRELKYSIDAVLEKAFPKENTLGSVMTKSNYINLIRYLEQPENTVLEQIKKILILGAGNTGREIYHQMVTDNRTKTKWSIEGFWDYHIKTIPDLTNGCDVIGSLSEIETLEIDPDILYINALDNSGERRQAYHALSEKGAQFFTYIEEEAQVRPFASVGEGCVLTGKCDISGSATIGVCTMIRASMVDSGVRIGDCCILETGCWVGANSTIGNDTVIGAFSKIAPGVLIGDGVKIPALSEIKKDVLL